MRLSQQHLLILFHPLGLSSPRQIHLPQQLHFPQSLSASLCSHHVQRRQKLQASHWTPPLMSAPLSCHSLAPHGLATAFGQMPLHLCQGIFPPSSKLMTLPAPKMRTVHPHRVPHQQRHCALLCRSIATQHLRLLPLVPPSQQRHPDWPFPPDQNRLGDRAALLNLLLDSQQTTCVHHRAAPLSLDLLPTQPSPFQRSPSLQHSLLWFLTLDPIH